MLKLVTLAIVIPLLSVFVTACDEAEESLPQGPAATSQQIPPSPSVAVALGGTDPATVHSMGNALYAPQYTSLVETARVYNEVIVGTVTNILLPFDPRPGYQGLSVEDVVGASPKSSWTPSAEEMARAPGRDFSVYAVKVDTVIQSKLLKVGDEIGILQSGGLFEGEAYQTDGDPIIQGGARYLFFLEPYPGLEEISVKETWGTTYSGPPFGRFSIDESGRLAAVDAMWLCEVCKAPRTLQGTTADVAAQRIQLASEGKLSEVDLAPVPEAPTPQPIITPIVTTDDKGQPTLIPVAP